MKSRSYLVGKSNYSLGKNQYKTNVALQIPRDESLGNWINKISDHFCETDRIRSKNELWTIFTSRHQDYQKLDAFNRLKTFSPESYKSNFKIHTHADDHSIEKGSVRLIVAFDGVAVNSTLVDLKAEILDNLRRPFYSKNETDRLIKQKATECLDTLFDNQSFRPEKRQAFETLQTLADYFTREKLYINKDSYYYNGVMLIPAYQNDMIKSKHSLRDRMKLTSTTRNRVVFDTAQVSIRLFELDQNERLFLGMNDIVGKNGRLHEKGLLAEEIASANRPKDNYPLIKVIFDNDSNISKKSILKNNNGNHSTSKKIVKP